MSKSPEKKQLPENIQEILEAAYATSADEKVVEEQRRSFAYGNAHIENERVTREMVNEIADKKTT